MALEENTIDLSDHFNIKELDRDVRNLICDDHTLDLDGDADYLLSTELSSYGFNDQDVYDLLDSAGVPDLPEDLNSDEWRDLSNDFLGYPDLWFVADKLNDRTQLPGGGYGFGFGHQGGFGLMFYADLDDVNTIREEEGCPPFKPRH